MLLISLLVACPHPVEPALQEPTQAQVRVPKPGELLLLHTNDLHGHFLPERAKWLEGEPAIGGFQAIDAWVNRAEAEWGEDRVLLLDGGDLLTGTPLTDLEVRGFYGGAMLEFLEAIGYDAWVVGNHEFDKGFENAARMVQASAIPALSSNLLGVEGGTTAIEGLQESIVLDVAGIRVGLIGATTSGLTHLASAETMKNIDLREPIETVQAQIDALDAETDILVVLSHIGLDADRRLAAGVTGLDVIVGGHSHTPMQEAEQVNGTWIVQAGSYGRSIGQAVVSVTDDAVTGFDWDLHDLTAAAVPEGTSEEVSALVTQYEERLTAEFGQVVGEALDSLGRSYDGPSTLGNWITDTLRTQTGAHIGLYNAGGIRSDLAKGPITKGDLFQIFPFSNAVVTFEISGSELLGILLRNVQSAVDGSHGSMQLSGAQMTWRMKMGVPEAVSITVGDAPLDPGAIYTVATNTYVVDQAEKYLPGADPKNVVEKGMTVFDAALGAVKEGPVSVDSVFRLQQVE